MGKKDPPPPRPTMARPAPRTCPPCNGTGKIKEVDPRDGTTDLVTCGRCNGTGKI